MRRVFGPAEVGGERDRRIDDDEDRQERQHKPVGRGAGPVRGVRRQHSQQGRIGNVDRRIGDHQQTESHVRVNHPSGTGVTRRGEGEHGDDGHGQRHPQQIGAKVSPARIGSIGDSADERINDRVTHPGDQHHGPHGRRAEQEHVRIELGDVDGEHLPKHGRREVAETVADLLHNGEPRRFVLHGEPRL